MEEGLDLELNTVIPSQDSESKSKPLSKTTNGVNALAKRKETKLFPLAQTNKEPALSVKKQKEKESLSRLLVELDDVRLNLEDSGGQGYLMNASAIISTYIRNNY